MSRSARKRDKRELEKLMVNVEKQMMSFEVAIEDLKTFKDSLLDLDDEIEAKHTEINSKKKALDEDFQDHKLRKLREVAQSLDKVIVSQEDVAEKDRHLANVQEQLEETKEKFEDSLNRRVQEEVERRIKILNLENQKNNIELVASNKNYEREISNLKENMDRMSKELDSQKNLTASIAGGSSSSRSGRGDRVREERSEE